MTFVIHRPYEYFFGCRRFAIWHRNHLPDSFRAVDIDLVGTNYGRVAYVIESTTSEPDGKNCNVTRQIADATGARAYVVQIPRIAAAPDWVPWRQCSDYINTMDAPKSLTVRQIYPPPEWQKNLSWAEFAEVLREAREDAR